MMSKQMILAIHNNSVSVADMIDIIDLMIRENENFLSIHVEENLSEYYESKNAALYELKSIICKSYISSKQV